MIIYACAVHVPLTDKEGSRVGAEPERLQEPSNSIPPTPILQVRTRESQGYQVTCPIHTMTYFILSFIHSFIFLVPGACMCSH